jgi:hypothetical protein
VAARCPSCSTVIAHCRLMAPSEICGSGKVRKIAWPASCQPTRRGEGCCTYSLSVTQRGPWIRFDGWPVHT